MIYVMVLFSIIGGLDNILGNKYGLGVKFEEGFKAMGGLALTIIGIYSLSPLLGKALMPILNPLSQLLGADPSVFISSLLAIDLGGYTTSMEIANNPLIGEYNGIILASMLGTTISFTIPVAVSLVSPKDFPYFAKGILAGIIATPAGLIVSGLMMQIGIKNIMINLIPVLLFNILITIGLIKFQNKTLEMFNKLGKAILTISTIGLLISILDFMFGIKLIEGMIPFEEGAILVAKIGIILSGAYPLLIFLANKLQRYIRVISEKYGLDEYSILGIFSSLANCIPMLGVYDKMNDKGKVINAAFAVSGAFTLGGQLGYISTVAPEFINPFIVGKLTAGILAIFLAIQLIKRDKIVKEAMDNGSE